MKHFRIPAIFLGLLAICSCTDTLDTHPTDSFTKELVWSSKSTITNFIYSTISSVLTEKSSYAGDGNCIWWESYTPNCASANDDAFYDETGITANSDFGANRFASLRKCNLIIERVNSSEILSQEEKDQLSAYGYLLRGMVFFDQTRKMGRFVPVCQVFDTENEKDCEIPMTSSVAESYKYVMDDLEKAAANLPATAESGMPTKWAAEVLLSRACLQAYAYTSDKTYLDKAYNAAKDVVTKSGISLSTSTGLFDSSDMYNPEILWGYYRLSENTNVSSLAEIVSTMPNIFASYMEESDCEHKNNSNIFQCWGRCWPTQDMVDQYLVNDESTGEALPWYETSQYKENVTELDPKTVTEAGQIDVHVKTTGDVKRMPCPQDFELTREGFDVISRYATLKEGATRNISDIMYSNRDKRFYTNIAYDGCMWLGEYVDTYWGGNMFQGVGPYENGGMMITTTNYYWKKNNAASNFSPSAIAVYSTKIDYGFFIARLAEAYLNLAEASLLKGQVSEAVEALNVTRTTHGGIAPSKATTEAEAWADYIRERNCELCNEGGDIYFSLLRWGKYGGNANHGRAPGDIVYDLDRPSYKIEINSKRSSILVLQMTNYNNANRRFSSKRYLLPIQKGFLETREAYGLDHTQNPGW